MKNQTHTVTHIAERCEKRGGSGTLKKFPDLLIFDKNASKPLHCNGLTAKWVS